MYPPTPQPRIPALHRNTAAAAAVGYLSDTKAARALGDRQIVSVLCEVVNGTTRPLDTVYPLD